MYNVLITGASGFIGRNLTEFLLRETKYNIVSMHRTYTANQPYSSGKRLRAVCHDLKNPISKSVSAEIGEIHYIVHLAGMNGVYSIPSEIEKFISNNVLATANLMEYARHNNRCVRKILYLSTAEVFGPAEPGHIFDEDDDKNPASLYANTKMNAESFCMLYEKSFSVPSITAYAMNTFGAYQQSNKFVPLLVEKIMKGEEVCIYMDQNGATPNRRNYLHIDDLCDAMLFLLHHGTPGQRYNIASEEESNNLKLAQLIAELLGKSLKYKLVERPPDSPLLPRLNGQKLLKMGWCQKMNLKEGLERALFQMTPGGDK